MKTFYITIYIVIKIYGYIEYFLLFFLGLFAAEADKGRVRIGGPLARFFDPFQPISL